MRELQLSKGLVALVDDEDWEWARHYKWYAKRYGFKGQHYAVRKTSRVDDPEHKQHLLALHREILGLKPKDSLVADHVNGNTLDNRRCNLRKATKQENNRNRRINQKCTSGYKGVRQYRKRWVATICVDNKTRHIGYFSTKEQAKEAYNKAASELFGAFARLN